jgi:DNA-binding NarL/FixJ family response regulator
MHSTGAPTVVMCDTEPLALEGFRVLLSCCEGLDLTAAQTPTIRAMEAVRQTSPAVAPIDGEIGIHAALDRVRTIRECSPRSAG